MHTIEKAEALKDIDNSNAYPNKKDNGDGDSSDDFLSPICTVRIDKHDSSFLEADNSSSSATNDNADINIKTE